MATSRDIRPFSIVMCLSRIAQLLVTITILGLDIYVLDEWNRNQYDFNSALGDATAANGPDIKTWVGGTPFTGIVIFTVSHPVVRTLTLP